MDTILVKCGFLLVLFTLFTVIHGADKTVTQEGISVKVLGQSGKINIYNASDETNSVTITYDFLTEYDTNGDAIQGQSPHTLNTFASQSFEFTDEEVGSIGSDNVAVTQFSFVSNISIGTFTAKLSSFVYIFTEDGNITVDGENVMVKAGDVKFNAKMEDWPFCGAGAVTCASGQTALVGKYLDFGIEMKGKGDSTPEMTTGSTYSLGDESTVLVPKQVTYDGSDTKNMPEGYPKLETKGNKQLFIFRFEKFSTSALYDPIVSLSKESNDGKNGSAAVTASMTSLILLTLVHAIRKFAL